MRVRILSMACIVFQIFMSAVVTYVVPAEASMADSAIGIPFGWDPQGADDDICPEGERTINMFLAAWKKDSYEAMYDLIDDESKNGYPLKEASADFRLLSYKPYTVTSRRQNGENFEFMLSYGDWKDGNKDTKKMIISGKTFKIIMPSKHSPFKSSLENYF